MKYAIAATVLTEKIGGKYIVKGAVVNAFDGSWPIEEKSAISRWATRTAALAFWSSAKYAKIVKQRLGKAKVGLNLFEGIDEKAGKNPCT